MKITDPASHPEPYVTVAEVAAYLRVTEDQVRRWIAHGTLAAHRFGPRQTRIPVQAVRAFVAWVAEGRG